nr:hypothetical protein CFP56_59772 [Quercus suber]
MGKSSSSSKKKRSKNSSQGRTRKGSKSRRVKKYNKSKKLRHRDDSLSSEEDDSKISVSVSCSSSEDDYKSRRARSRTRKDLKGSKKRAHRRSYSSESGEENKKRTRGHSRRRESSEESTRVRKKIGSKRKESSEDGRKTHKKKPRREASSIESYKYPSEEKKTGVNNSKRLRSVITVMEEENEDRVSNKDEYKEEIVYDNDDYPSCRSNDSNDGGYKRELDHQSNVAAAKKMRVDNEKVEEPVISNIRISELTESGKDIENQYNGCNPSSSGVGRNDGVKGKVAEVSGHVNGDNMESILRQRALENLIKFRGGLQTNANTPASKKDKNDDDVKQPSTAEAELVQINLPKEDGAKIVGTNPPQEDDAKLKGATKEVRENRVPALRRDGAKIVGTKSPKEHDAKLQGATGEGREIRVPALRRLSNFLLRNDEKIPDGKDVGHKSGSAQQEYPCAPHQVAIAEKPHENVNSAVGSVIARPKLVTPLARKNSFKTHSTLKQTPTSGESHLANVLVAGKTLGKSAAEPAQTVSPSSNNSDEDIKKASGSAAPKSSSSGNSILAENSSNKPQEEVTEGSQFEQKTMTVMRGGEMVQVSYKVYIPKKASALARRQLKR